MKMLFTGLGRSVLDCLEFAIRSFIMTIEYI